MARVLIVERDDDIRESLRTLLELSGYSVVVATSMAVGLGILEESAEPLVVLCSNARPTHARLTGFFAHVAEDAGLAGRHGYICLSTSPDRLPPELRALVERLAVPVIGKPFDMYTVLERVMDVAARIGVGTSPARPTSHTRPA
jgi:CheY-like chemotaxis protein